MVATAPHTHAAYMQPVEAHMAGSTGAAGQNEELMSHTVKLSAGAGTFLSSLKLTTSI